MKKIAHIFLLLCLLAINMAGQRTRNVKDSTISISLVDVGYSFQVPGGDMAKRYGPNSMLGISFGYKTNKNWLWSISGNFLFGSRIKEDSLFSALTTSQGFMLTNVGTYAEVYLYERGYTAGASLGKLIPWGPNRNSGIFISAGAGFINHKIRIEVANNNVYALTDEYKKGYDRKTNGLYITEFIGYRYMGNKKLLNFFAGFEFYQGFTQGRRPYNFDQMAPDNNKRLDLLYGLRIGWTLPLYRRDPGTYFYN